MQSQRNNSLDPISIGNWRWAYFLDETIKAFSIFQPRPYSIKNDFLFKESCFGSTSNPKKVFLETFPSLSESDFEWGKTQKDYENWDSFAQLNLITLAEAKFEITFSDDEVISISSAKNLLECIKSHL